MVCTIKRFLQVHKNSTTYISTINSFSYILSYINLNMKFRILLSESKLQDIDNIIVTEKGIQSFVHKFYKYFFNTWKEEDGTIVTIIWFTMISFWIVLENSNSFCSFEYWWKNTVIKERLNKSSDCRVKKFHFLEGIIFYKINCLDQKPE